MPINRFSIALICALPLLALAATASMQDASQLFKQGQHAAALTKINAHLSDNPKDAQGRFLKGLILTELNRYPEAIKVFSDLTEDYPELPEPYNNLAVLYAAQGQYERAKQSLEMAIRTHPSYTTAHENLGDIYAKMASLAYDKALQLDQSNVSAQTKLALIKDLFGPSRVNGSTAAVSQSGRPAPAKTAAKAKEPAPAEPDPAKPVAEAASGSPPAAGAEQSPPLDRPVDQPAAQPPTEAKSTIEQLVTQWAEAWSNKDVAAYLAFYGEGFRLPPGRDRAAWEAERRERLEKPDYIKVEVGKLRVDVKGDTARARFSQRYEANHLKGTYQKTLELARENGAWKIVNER